MTMTQRRELIDRAKFKALHTKVRDRVARNLAPSRVVVRASVWMVGDQLKEGRLGDHRVLADEPVERGGTNQAPAPLEYFVGAVGF
jgi:hypothetical protein